MKLIKPSFEIIQIMSNNGDKFSPLKLIEYAGRVCYKSEGKITKNSSKEFIKKLMKSGHHSVIEHSSMSVKFICDRGVTHELVRHRLCSFSQESTRYCNYKGGVTFIIPPWLDRLIPGEYTKETYQDCFKPKSSKTDLYGNWTKNTLYKTWITCMLDIEEKYINLIHAGWSPQQARSVLPNSTKTEIIVTTNLREWRHIFKLRCSKASHPQMRELMQPLLSECNYLFYPIFDDLK